MVCTLSGTSLFGEGAALPELKPAPRVVSLIIPVFNEEASIGPFLERLQQVGLAPGAPGGDRQRLEIVFVNDGSTDRTVEMLLKAQSAAPSCWRIIVVELSRNFGKEAALTAGLGTVSGDVAVPIDVDLQDPPELIPAMVEKWREGFEVVLARRDDRRGDSLLKRLPAGWFYHLHNWMADLKLPHNVGDFRLMDRVVVEALKELPESRRFMKGLFAWVGFRTATVDYTRAERARGESKFNGRKLLSFAVEGVTSFSDAPLRLWTYLGSAIAMLSLLWGGWIALRTILYGADLPGYPSIFVAVTFFGGLQLIGIGVLGEYLGRTYIEAKRRPVYFVRRIHLPPD
jgi:glycosyltransferase involved in cell wall biosynthesis